MSYITEKNWRCLGLLETYLVPYWTKYAIRKCMFLEVMKYIHVCQTKDIGITKSSQVFTSQFSVEIKVSN